MSECIVQIKAEECLSVKDANALMGYFLDEQHYDLIIETDTTVLTPKGEPLLIFRKQVLSAAACKAAYPALRKAATVAGNRGVAAGIVNPGEFHVSRRKAIKATSGAKTRMRPIKKDGTLSKTSYGKTVPSGIIGYMDRNTRFPYCRLTAFNMNQPENWAAALPYIKEISEVFKKECPERYEAQMACVKETSPDFYIHGTAFTTVTVNRNFRTAAHKDAGDLPQGFGVMSVLRAGHYEGGLLIFPRYRVAVNMGTRDVLLANVHQVHGNSPIIGVEGAYERISTVLYYRKRMIHCGTIKQERERAKHRKLGDKIYED